MNFKDIFKIGKRKKPEVEMPRPDSSNNWKEEEFQKNVKRGVEALHKGKKVQMFDDGRGFELALEIKRKFIQDYTKQLAEKVKIKPVAGREFTVELDPIN